MRVLAWPRSPRRMTSCPASRAFSSWGRTVSSKPSTPSMRGCRRRCGAAALRRISSWTGTDSHPEARRSPSVAGRSDGGSGGISGAHQRRAYARPRRRPAVVAGLTARLGSWCAGVPRWKDDDRRSPGDVARHGFETTGRAGASGRVAARADRTRRRMRGREHHTRGPEAGYPVATGRGAGRSRRQDAAAGPLVAQPGGHRGVPHVVRRLLDLGRLPERQLLRGRGHAPGPHLAALLPLPRRELRARGPNPSSPWAGGRSRRRSSSWPFRAGSGSPATTTARPTTGASGSPRPRAAWPTPTPGTRGRPASR